MPYDPTVWVDEITPLSAANLNKIEEALDDAHDQLDNLSAEAADISISDAAVRIGG